MRRFMIWILILCLCLSLVGCGAGGEKPDATEPVPTIDLSQAWAWCADYTVPSPMAYPDYGFDHTPTTGELRQMAIKAMRDEVTIQWSVDKFYSYSKIGSISDKFWTHAPQVVYSGLPYTNGDGGIVQMMEFYDTQTGMVSLPGNMNDLIGNSCAGSICAAWNTVCDSLYGYQSTMEMTPANGFLPVGPYETYTKTDTFRDYKTGKVCQDNGEEVMYESYACVLPADALTSNTADHAIMAIEKAHVVRDASGKIDPNKSYIKIMDQRGGNGNIFYKIQEDGITVHRSGRLEADFTFASLYKNGYLPVTSAEFVGKKPYSQAKVEFDASGAADLKTLLGGTITSNYPMCIVRLTLSDGSGVRTVAARYVLDKYDIDSGLARKFPLSKLDTEGLTVPKGSKLTLEAVVSTAESFTLATLEGTDEPVAQKGTAAPCDGKIYWNVDKGQFPPSPDTGFTTRPLTDGKYHIQMAVDGGVVSVPFADRGLVAQADALDCMGLVLDKDGVVTRVVPIEEFTGGTAVLDWYVMEFDATGVKCSMDNGYSGPNFRLPLGPNTKVYDITKGRQVGAETVLTPFACIKAVMGADGTVSHIWIEHMMNPD